MGKKSKSNKAKANAKKNKGPGPTAVAMASRIAPPSIAPKIIPRPELPREESQQIKSGIPDALLDAALSRGANAYFTKEGLRSYFVKLVSDPCLQGISIPLLNGLANGPPLIHKRVTLFPGQEEAFPLLFWVCQWKLLRIQGYWPAESEMVDMVLKAGANEQINTTMNNHTNALFFAVKYADLKAVDLLIQAGVKIDQQDNSGRTCLKNALEHPQPPIIQRLLEHLPATEMTAYHTPDGNTFLISLADHVVELMTNANTLISWVNLGPPPADFLNDALIQLRKKGCRFTGGGSHRGGIGLSNLGAIFRSDAILPAGWNAPESFKELARTLIGEYLPETLRPQGEDESEVIEKLYEAGDACPICLETSKKRITLYCGHTFCLDCIISHGKECEHPVCPVCRAQLCLDLQYPKGRGHMALYHVYGTSQSTMIHGVDYLTDDQVVEEAKYQGIFYPAASTARLRAILEEDVQTEPMKSSYTVKGEGTQTEVTEEAQITLDLSIEKSICGGGKFYIHPGRGRVSIEVSVKGVPLVAYIANRNFYTLISKSVVDQLRLRRIGDLQSKKFVTTFNAQKVRNLKFTCLEKFTLMVGNVEVTLRNAVEVSPDPYPLYGIQLGCDFLNSGVWSAIDVELSASDVNSNDPVLYRLGRDICWPVKQKTKEMFRFYTHDGTSAHLPLLHFSPFDHNIFHGISLRSHVKFDACYWCCRTFPEGMQACPSCLEAGRTVTYCDTRCQTAGWKVHKRTIGCKVKASSQDDAD